MDAKATATPIQCQYFIPLKSSNVKHPKKSDFRTFPTMHDWKGASPNEDEFIREAFAEDGLRSHNGITHFAFAAITSRRAV